MTTKQIQSALTSTNMKSLFSIAKKQLEKVGYVFKDGEKIYELIEETYDRTKITIMKDKCNFDYFRRDYKKHRGYPKISKSIIRNYRYISTPPELSFMLNKIQKPSVITDGDIKTLLLIAKKQLEKVGYVFEKGEKIISLNDSYGYFIVETEAKINGVIVSKQISRKYDNTLYISIKNSKNRIIKNENGSVFEYDTENRLVYAKYTDSYEIWNYYYNGDIERYKNSRGLEISNRYSDIKTKSKRNITNLSENEIELLKWFKTLLFTMSKKPKQFNNLSFKELVNLKWFYGDNIEAYMNFNINQELVASILNGIKKSNFKMFCDELIEEQLKIKFDIIELLNDIESYYLIIKGYYTDDEYTRQVYIPYNDEYHEMKKNELTQIISNMALMRPVIPKMPNIDDLNDEE